MPELDGVVNSDEYYIREAALRVALEAGSKRVVRNSYDPMDADHILDEAKKIEEYLRSNENAEPEDPMTEFYQLKELPVFLPGNSRDWQEVRGSCTIEPKTGRVVVTLSPKDAEYLLALHGNGLLWQMAFDYKMPVETVEKMNNQFGRMLGEKITPRNIKKGDTLDVIYRVKVTDLTDECDIVTDDGRHHPLHAYNTRAVLVKEMDSK